MAAAALAACPRAPAREPVVPQPLTEEEKQVKSTVNRYIGQILYCYEKVLKTDPKVEGRVEVGWTVSGGVVSGRPHIIVNTTGNDDLADCLMRKIARWEFPAGLEGDVSWPFAFQPR